MIRRPPRSTLDRSSAASDVYKRQGLIIGMDIASGEQNDDVMYVPLIQRAHAMMDSKGALYVGAVSYTHLRAHETVLDIVCRLLLEKKKKYIKIHKRLY